MFSARALGYPYKNAIFNKNMNKIDEITQFLDKH